MLTRYKHNTKHIEGANAPFFVFILSITFLLGLSKIGFGQNHLYSLSIDTLKPDRQAINLDTVDLQLANGIRNIPGNGYGISNYHLGLGSFVDNHGFQLYNGFTPIKRQYTFCAIPFITVQYGFGSKNTQYAGLTYMQSFSPNKHLALRYKQFKSDGFLRNNQSNSKLVDLRYIQLSKKNITEINALVDLDQLGFSGGITDVSLANTYDLSSIPVNFENAQTQSNRFQVQLNQHHNMSNDSLVSRGTALELAFKTKEVIYQDEGNLTAQYTQINWDSLATRDAYQWNQAGTALSLFNQTQNSYLAAGFFGRYWNYFNRKNELDTIELGIQGKLYINPKTFEWKTDFDYIVSGAQQGYHMISAFNFTKNNWKLHAHVNYSNQLPAVNQRSVWGNNYNSLASNWNKEIRFNATSTIAYQLKNQSFLLAYQQFNAKDNYFFTNGKWRNDVFKLLTIQEIQFQHELTLSKIRIKSTYTYTTDKLNLRIIPMHALRVRFQWNISSKNAKISKSIGGEFIAFNEYARVGYTPMTNTFDLGQLTNLLPGRNTANMFMAIQLGALKAFVRYENLGYFWTDKTYIELTNFPLASPMLKIGLSWDFYN